MIKDLVISIDTIQSGKLYISDQAIWRLKDGNHCYAKFEVLKIEYNIP